MKDQKYMVGNWVMSTKFKTPVQLTLADFAEANHYADGTSSLEWFNLNVSPIPLNEEWMRRCEQFKECKIEDNTYYYNNFEFTFPNYFTWKNAVIDKQRLKYVHLFQQLFESLEGKELTIKP